MTTYRRPYPAGGLTTQQAADVLGVYGIDDSSELSWMDLSRCAEVDPELHFPEKGGSTQAPKRICAQCEVRAECLGYALEHDERFGVWGGFSERERRRLKHQFGDDTAAAVSHAIPQPVKAVA